MKKIKDTPLKNRRVSLLFGMSVDLTIDRYSLNVLLNAALRFAIKLIIGEITYGILAGSA